MARSLRLLAILFLTWFTQARAEHVILTGGPALRQWENLRVPRDQHDRWWANFVRASTLRIAELRTAYGSGASVTWMVYRHGYELRGREDGQPYVRWIEKLARDRRVTLIWIDSTGDLISAINNRPHKSIQTFDYFGHSNRHCFMLDYGASIMAASTAWLHERDLSKLRRSVFADNAYCKSWGCHTAESMSDVWRRTLGMHLEGARGKTDYTVVGQGKLPIGEGWVR